MRTQSYGSKDVMSMIAKLPFLEFTKMSTRQIAWSFIVYVNVSQSLNNKKGGIFMNINVKYSTCKNLSEIVNKDIAVKFFSKYMSNFELYRKFSANSIENLPLKTDKIIAFNKIRKNNSFHLQSMLSNNIMQFVITSVCTVMFMSMLGMSFSNVEKPTANYVTIQVHSGDTVWTIASQYASNKEDLREMVYAINTMNGLNHNAVIYSGQALKVPTPTNRSIEGIPNPAK